MRPTKSRTLLCLRPYLGLVLGVLSLLHQAPSARAQEAVPPMASPPAAPANASRLGRYHLGPFYVTPRLHVGPIGFDTNVLYTPTDRHPDFTVQAGPALDLVLPSLQYRTKPV